MPRRPYVGRSSVTRRAIVDVVRTSVRGSYGVVAFAAPGLGGRLGRAMGIGEPGIRLRLASDLRIDLHLRVAYGLPIAEVARQVDSAVRHALRHDLGRDVAELTIHVDGLEYRPGPIPELPVADIDGGDGDPMSPGTASTPASTSTVIEDGVAAVGGAV